jgi:hypothetical protein
MLVIIDIFMYQTPMSAIQGLGFGIAVVGTYRYSQLKKSPTPNAQMSIVDVEKDGRFLDYRISDDSQGWTSDSSSINYEI